MPSAGIFEPLTYCLPVGRSTTSATNPDYYNITAIARAICHFTPVFLWTKNVRLLPESIYMFEFDAQTSLERQYFVQKYGCQFLSLLRTSL